MRALLEQCSSPLFVPLVLADCPFLALGKLINNLTKGEDSFIATQQKNNYKRNLLRTRLFVYSDIFSSHFRSILLSFFEAYPFLFSSVLVLTSHSLLAGLPFPSPLLSLPSREIILVPCSFLPPSVMWYK